MQLDTLIAKLDRRPADRPNTKDERLARTSAETGPPPSQPAAAVEAPRPLPRRVQATEPSFSQRRVVSPFDEAARLTDFQRNARAVPRPVAPTPAPDTSDAPKPVAHVPVPVRSDTAEYVVGSRVNQRLAPIPAPNPIEASEPAELAPRPTPLAPRQDAAEPAEPAPGPAPLVPPHQKHAEPAGLASGRSPGLVDAPASVEPASAQSRPRIPQPRTYIPPPRVLRSDETDDSD